MNPTPEHSPGSIQPWQRLFAPLPVDAIPRRSPVAPPEILAKPEGAAIAGWEHLTVQLSVPCEGLRMVLVVLDASGQPISASDMVLYQSETAEGTEYRQESLGGRLEADGTFRGTRWHMLTVQTAEGGEVQKEATSSEPSAEDISALKALVAEVLRRAP
jgi:hypothetical protein